MSEYRTILEVLETDGQMPRVPRGLVAAIKYVKPDWTTYGGYAWPFPGKWTPEVSDSEWDPKACHSGGVHVATTLEGAQSGGGLPHHCLVVSYYPSDAGEWDRPGPASGKLKVRRAKTLAVVDLFLALRRRGSRADLQGAYLWGANLRDASLWGAYLRDAYLQGANLRDAYLQGADLQGADLRGANLQGADLRNAYLRGADLQGADLRGAYLRGVDLHGAYLRGALGVDTVGAIP